MPGQQRHTSKASRPRIRAGKACKRCNQKRIKCDAMNRMPCTNCSQGGHTDCALRQSRRGTYIRTTRRRPREETSNKTGPPYLPGREDAEDAHTDANEIGDGLTRGAGPRLSTETIGCHDPYLGLAGTTRGHATGFQPGDIRSEKQDQHETGSNCTGSQPSEGAQTTRAPSSIHGTVSSQHTPPTQSSKCDSSTCSPGNASSFRDLSWTTMFDHLLNTRQNSKGFVDKCSITYLGESFPLAIVLEDLKEGGRPKLHHPGPPFPENEQQTGVPDRLQPAHILPEDLHYLQTKGVFDFPANCALDALFTVFLEQVYPMYPIVNRDETIQQHQRREIPVILLHSICFIAATFCPLSVLYQVGFTSRREARLSYYKKVKVLFDCGYEINKIVILQSAILMSFWGGGPNNYWNFYSWISTAVTVAEAIGLHRSIATTNMKAQDKSLLRRIWWILVVRDSSCSALVGRPFRIDLNQGDTEMLTLEDFAHDLPGDDFPPPRSDDPSSHYQIQVARLSLILRDIVISRFYPGSPQAHPAELHTRLTSWRDRLPPVLAWREDSADYHNPFSMALSVLYNHHLILIYLGYVPTDSANIHDDASHYSDITASAAHEIASLACTVVTKSSVLHMPHELLHGIFMAQAVFYTQLRSTNRLVAQLGRSELANCQMVLHESRESWDPSTWIMQLFDNLSTRLVERPSAHGEDNQDSHGHLVSSGTDWMNSSNPEAGVFHGLLGYDPWQSHPMLSSLFDLPAELLLPE